MVSYSKISICPPTRYVISTLDRHAARQELNEFVKIQIYVPFESNVYILNSEALAFRCDKSAKATRHVMISH
jgi:hypothetical protein